MPLFIAVHQWKPEEDWVILKEMAAFGAAYPEATPKGVELIATYTARAQRAFCVWKSIDQESLEKLFDQYMPTLKVRTEFVPVLQMFPPTVDYVVSLWKTMLQAAPK